MSHEGMVGKKMKNERQSNFELLKICAMIMIVAHHFVAKNALNVDTDIIGITTNKLFLQFIGNHAFIGNNLFFMCSAWFLVNKDGEVSSYPQRQLRHIWTMEKAMLFYSLCSWLVFRFFIKSDEATNSLLFKSVFPLSTNLWWYPTCYAAFLLIQPFYHKGLSALGEKSLNKLLLTFFVIWSISTIIPFFDYGSSNFLCFIVLYAVIYKIKNYGSKIFNDRGKCRKIIIYGYAISAISIVCLDLLGTHVRMLGEYACYFIRGNYRFLPMIISIAIFSLCIHWKIRSKTINYIASLTFGVYLIHMYPITMGYLFGNKGSVFDMSVISTKTYLPLWATIGILVCFIACAGIEMIRKILDGIIVRIAKKKRYEEESWGQRYENLVDHIFR